MIRLRRFGILGGELGEPLVGFDASKEDFGDVALIDKGQHARHDQPGCGKSGSAGLRFFVAVAV